MNWQWREITLVASFEKVQMLEKLTTSLIDEVNSFLYQKQDDFYPGQIKFLKEKNFLPQLKQVNSFKDLQTFSSLIKIDIYFQQKMEELVQTLITVPDEILVPLTYQTLYKSQIGKHLKISDLTAIERRFSWVKRCMYYSEYTKIEFISELITKLLKVHHLQWAFKYYQALPIDKDNSKKKQLIKILKYAAANQKFSQALYLMQIYCLASEKMDALNEMSKHEFLTH